MQRVAHTLAWALPLALLLTAIVAVPVMMFEPGGLPRWRALRQELRQLNEHNERLRLEVERLHREIEALRTDPATVERVARDELGLVRPGDLVLLFPADSEAP
ncbi:MAG: septum formation initiator family protein [Myxococcota bacterium]|nr:septum formation initiator family protein [Myxococcota bacterium]